MTPNTEFRLLETKDHAEAIELYKDGFANLQKRNNKENEHVKEREADKITSLLNDASADFWGYFEDGELVGFAALTRPNAVIEH